MVVLRSGSSGTRIVWHIKNWLICPPPVGRQRGFLSAVHCMDMVWLLQVKLTKVRELPEGWIPSNPPSDGVSSEPSAEARVWTPALVPKPLRGSHVHLSVSPPLGMAICLVTSTSRTAGYLLE